MPVTIKNVCMCVEPYSPVFALLDGHALMAIWNDNLATVMFITITRETRIRKVY